MDALARETQARLFKDGKKLTALAVADPTVTIIEVGKTPGFLLAESCIESNSPGVKLHLEQVNWIRYRAKRKIFVHHPHFLMQFFPEVTLYRHATGVFVAQDTSSMQYIPWSSVEPYSVIFISKDRYDGLHHEIQQHAFEQLLGSVKAVAQDAPGFSFDDDTLRGPVNYARPVTRRLDHRFIEV